MEQHSSLTEQQVKDGCAAILYLLIVIPLDAFMVWLFWGFFVVPLGVIAINFWWAMGLSAFVSYMLVTSNGSTESAPSPTSIFLKHITVTIVCLVLALIARLLMGV